MKYLTAFEKRCGHVIVILVGARFLIALLFLICFVSLAHAAEQTIWYAYQTPLFSGSYSYGSQVDLPPGTHGMTPLLSVSYNSYLAKNKAGWVGAGWEIPTSYIQANTDGTFSLFLNGAKHKLILAADGRYHTTIETYLKIEKKTGATNEKGAYWTVIDTSGTEYRFGSTLDSENIINTSDPAITPYVWRWSLDRIKDSNGNCIYYTYAENPTTNDKGAVYLSKIEYNTEKKRLVEFILENNDRPDMSLIIDQGSEVQEARRLAEIRVSVDGQPAKKLVLRYAFSAPANTSLLTSITKYGSDWSTALPAEQFEYTSFSDGTTTDLLTGITGALGNRTTVQYSSSSLAPNSSLPENFWLATAITQSNGITGPQAYSAASILTYENGLYDLPAQEFRGFGKATETRPDGSKVIHTFHQDEAKKGRELSTMIVDGQDAPYLAVVNLWTAEQSNGITTVRLERTERSSYDGVLADPMVTRTEYANFDDYGNSRLIIDHGDLAVSSDTTYTTREYIYNPSLWIVNKVKHSVVMAALEPQKLRESWFYYDRAFDLDSPPFAGNLTKEEHWNNTGENPVITYKYDSYGNLSRKTDPLGHVTEIVYDTTYHTFPELVYNAKNHLVTNLFNPVIGKPVSVTDPNGITTNYGYDVFNRLIQVIKPYDDEVFPTTKLQYVINSAPPHLVIVKNRETASGSTFDSIQVIDGQGKTIQTKSESDNPVSMIAADIYYYVMGRVARQSNLYLTDNAVGYSAPNTGISSSQTEYDTLGRPTVHTNPDNTASSTTYSHWTTTETDENGHTKAQTFDAGQNLAQVVENNQDTAYTTRYHYSPLGELRSVTDHIGNTSTHVYDSLGRKIKSIDVDLGQRLFEYDLAGNMISQTDARGITIQYQYDALNRQTLIDYPHDKDIQFVYDLSTKGVLSMVYNSLGIDSYQYDQRMRKIQENRSMDDQTWVTKWSYDSRDRIISQTYPDGEVVQYTYTAQDKLAGIQRAAQSLLSNVAYNAAGQMTQKSYGNGWNTAFSYDPANLRLSKILTTQGAVKLQDLSYTYDNSGNVTTLKHAHTVTARTETFTYDDLYRLINAHDDLSTGGFDTSYSYNAIGNMLSETDNKTQAVTQYTYGQGTAKPHAVTGKTDKMPNVGSFVIDNGQAYSTRQQVTLNNVSLGVTAGNATDFYMASENADFSDGLWQPFSTAPVFASTKLPVGFKTSTNITIYFKVKNGNGESKSKSASIQWLSDIDGDGIPDLNDTDNDNDRIPDAWETAHGLNPFNPSDAAQYPPADASLTYLQKYNYGLNPDSADSDGDGWSDADEIFNHKTNPNMADTDKDGIPDPTDASPNNPYNEGVSETYSIKRWNFNQGGGRRSSTLYATTDALGSGFSKSPLVDTDGDGIPDSWEIAHGTDPATAADTTLDTDGDGLTNLQEYLYGTAPNISDSDNDGWSDYQEIFLYHTDPNATDSDHDGISDSQDPDPIKQTYIYGTSEHFTVRNGIFNAGGNRRNGAAYAVAADKIGGIPITGTIFHKTFSATPEVITFDNTQINQSKNIVLTIANEGTDNLIIGTTALAGSDNFEFAVVDDNCSERILSPSITCTMDISFTPTSHGAKGASLIVHYNDGEIKAASIVMTGIATQDNTPPDTTISSTPDTLTNSNSATFTFLSSEANATLECRLDNAAFTLCSSPKTYFIPTGDTHNFEVRAIDSSGNIDPTPAMYTWTIDFAPPNPPIVIGATPTSDTTPTWNISSGGNGGTGTFRCQLDSQTGAWAETNASSYTPEYPLGMGAHTLFVQERDQAGNWSASGSFAIIIMPQQTLSVSKIGVGTVISIPVGITCGSDCSEAYDYNTHVTLTAIHATGLIFLGWSGACTGMGPCMVSMDQAKNVAAIFGADGDGDGMSDSWESKNGLNPLVDDSLEDFDGDGYSNLHEFISDSNPSDNLSIPTPIADLNEDGDVDGEEMYLFSIEFGKNCSLDNPCQFDFNYDNKVDDIDLGIFIEDFGRIQ
jgi:YD repeat-containing protein